MIAFVMLTLSGCGTIRTRNSVQEPAAREAQEQAPESVRDHEEVTQGVAELPQPSAPGAPVFLSKELPKVGIILGPGGMKTFAHIGVLREFEKAKIPLRAVVGIEWGAVMGAIYAQQGQVNDVEWQSFKLRESELPGASLLSGKVEPVGIGSLQTFLDSVFSQTLMEKMKLGFACPAYWSKLDRFGWMQKGQIKEAMRACLPYPPLYRGAGGVYAAPFSVDAAAAWLRSRGAELIVLVNVMGKGELLQSRMAANQPSDELLWSEIRRHMIGAKSPVVHYTINVDTTGHPISDFAGRRAIMEAGSKSASEIVKKISTKHGY